MFYQYITNLIVILIYVFSTCINIIFLKRVALSTKIQINLCIIILKYIHIKIYHI